MKLGVAINSWFFPWSKDVEKLFYVLNPDWVRIDSHLAYPPDEENPDDFTRLERAVALLGDKPVMFCFYLWHRFKKYPKLSEAYRFVDQLLPYLERLNLFAVGWGNEVGRPDRLSGEAQLREFYHESFMPAKEYLKGILGSNVKIAPTGVMFEHEIPLWLDLEAEFDFLSYHYYANSSSPNRAFALFDFPYYPPYQHKQIFPVQFNREILSWAKGKMIIFDELGWSSQYNDDLRSFELISRLWAKEVLKWIEKQGVEYVSWFAFFHGEHPEMSLVGSNFITQPFMEFYRRLRKGSSTTSFWSKLRGWLGIAKGRPL